MSNELDPWSLETSGVRAGEGLSQESALGRFALGRTHLVGRLAANPEQSGELAGAAWLPAA